MGLNSNQLEKVGTALFGNAWQRALADELGVAERTMRRWASGESEIPEGISANLHAICLAHVSKLIEIAGNLAAKGKP